MPPTPHPTETEPGVARLAQFLAEQVNALIQIERVLRNSPRPRVPRLHPLLVSIIEDAISIQLLSAHSRLNQGYVLARALLERVTNYCFLLLCPDDQYSNFIDYSLNKAGRRANRSLEVKGQVVARIALQEGSIELPPEVQAAIAKFTSERGGEKTRWTSLSLQERAAAIEVKLGGTGLFVSLLAVYADASEALHGTLYGALFHLGTYDFVSVPHDQASLTRHANATKSALLMFSGGALDTLLTLLTVVGEPSAMHCASESKRRFKEANEDVGFLRRD